jgi:hypothetical protein
MANLMENIVTRYKGWSITELDGFFFYPGSDDAFETLNEIKDHIDYKLEDYDDSEEQRQFEDHWQNVNY